MIKTNYPDLTKCVYRGEGNCNIIITDLEKGIVYRILKNVSSKALYNKISENVPYLTYCFNRFSLRKFIGPELLPNLKVIDVDIDFLKNIEHTFSSCRPTYRQDKGVDLSCPRILALPDATLLPPHLAYFGEGPTLCVEIKPKFGAILQRPGSDDLTVITRRHAIFCMLQYSKLKCSIWDQKSSYCPCDLFSGNRCRMRRALNALLTVPQNNIRVFINGSLVFNHKIDDLDVALSLFFQDDLKIRPPSFLPNNSALEYLCDDLSSIELDVYNHILIRCRFISLLIDALLFKRSDSNDLVVRQEGFGFSCNLHPPDNSFSTFMHTSILGRVLSAQMLSSLGHDEVAKHYANVGTYLKHKQLKWSLFISGQLDLNDLDSLPGLRESFLVIEYHLIALAARDCSLMITFQKCKQDCSCINNMPVIDIDKSGQHQYITNAIVIDLDMKSLSTLNERADREHDIADEFRLCKHFTS